MILTFRPIRVWPDGWRDTDRDRRRDYSPFSAAYSDTLDLLDRELRHLGATEATLQVATSERDCRLDGQLRADARVEHPGVILTIETKRHGTLVYSTDRYRGRSYRGQGGWQTNLRAIALGLEALRKVERYGIAERGQQYAGYRELPSGIALGPVMTHEDAAAFLIEHGEWGGEDATFDDLVGDSEMVNAYYRSAAKRLHPDQGGDPALFRRLVEARDLLLAAS